jgi:hypothetical protein
MYVAVPNEVGEIDTLTPIVSEWDEVAVEDSEWGI